MQSSETKTDREHYIDILSQIATQQCAYSWKEWAERCDCKFHRGGELTIKSETSNGCPELRYIIRHLEELDDETFAEIFRWPGPGRN